MGRVILGPAARELRGRHIGGAVSVRARARPAVLDDVQAAPVEKLEVTEKWATVQADVGDARIRIVCIVRSPAVTMSYRGFSTFTAVGGVLGNSGTRNRPVRELAVGHAQERDRDRTTRPPSGTSPYKNARTPRERDVRRAGSCCPYEQTHTQGDVR